MGITNGKVLRSRVNTGTSSNPLQNSTIKNGTRHRPNRQATQQQQSKVNPNPGRRSPNCYLKVLASVLMDILSGNANICEQESHGQKSPIFSDKSLIIKIPLQMCHGLAMKQKTREYPKRKVGWVHDLSKHNWFQQRTRKGTGALKR